MRVWEDQIQVDLIMSAMIRGEMNNGKQSYGFNTSSPSKEDFLDICSLLVLDRPSLVRARSNICAYVTKMKASTSNVLFDHLNYDFKMNKEDTNLMFVNTLREKASEKVSVLKKKIPPNISQVKDGKQKMEQVTDIQLFIGWYTVVQGRSDHVAACMDSVWKARDYFSRFYYNLRKLTLGTDDVFKIDAFNSIKKFERKFDKKWTSCECDFKFGVNAYKSFTKTKYELPLSDPRNYVKHRQGSGGGGRGGSGGSGGQKVANAINEDDILHEEILKDFNGNLSQEEAEQLYSYLTTPYMRIPLVLDFFSRDRVGCLFNISLQRMLEETIFVPGRWGIFSLTEGKNLKKVPCDPQILHTQHGYLVAELERGPSITLASFLKLLQGGKKLAVGDYQSSFVGVLLFLLRLNVKMLMFIADVRSSGASSEMDVLNVYDAKLRKWMLECLVIVQQWLEEAESDSASADSSKFHAHIAMTGKQF